MNNRQKCLEVYCSSPVTNLCYVLGFSKEFPSGCSFIHPLIIRGELLITIANLRVTRYSRDSITATRLL